MRVQIRYDNNRLDIFDTASFTRPEPFDGANMLTNFEVRVDALGNTGLWLMAHFYDAVDGSAKQAKDDEVPIGRRKRGWRFLLAEAAELPCIESVSIDGQMTLMRVAGELADMVRFEQMCELWLPPATGEGIAKRAVRLFDTLCTAFPEDSANESEIARRCGFSQEAIDELRERTVVDIEPSEDTEEDDWLDNYTDEREAYEV